VVGLDFSTVSTSIFAGKARKQIKRVRKGNRKKEKILKDRVEGGEIGK